MVLDDINNPGNMGTILRMCDWFGVQTVVCSFGSVDVYNPKVVQSSMGSIFRTVIVYKNLKEYLEDNSNLKLIILILDNIIDPRNLGACIRSAAVTDVDALIINKYHCAPLNDVAHAVSAGGAEYVKTFYVSNLVNCIRHL